MKRATIKATSLALVLLLAFACKPKSEKAGGANQNQKKIPNVSVEAVAGRDMVEKIVLSGLISPNQEVLITAETSGVAERIVPKKGARVRQGEVLAEIDRQQSKASLDRAEAAMRQVKLAKDDAELDIKRGEALADGARIQLQQAKLGLEQARKVLEKAEVGLDNQRRHSERVKKLYEEKLASQAAFDDAQSALKAFEADHAAAKTGVENAQQTIGMAESNLVTAGLGLDGARLRVQTAQAEIQSTEAALAQARLHYDKGLITAPFDASVDDIFFEEGEYVKFESPVLKLIKTDQVKVKVSLAEKDAPYIKLGQPADITVGSLAGGSFSGKVSFVALSADTRTNTYPVEVLLPNPRGELKAGMVAQVTLSRRRVEGAVSVPTFAVITKEEGEVVFILENGKAVQRPVVTGILENGWIQISEGLKPGESLIVKGHRDLQDGQEVKVQP